MAWSGDISQMSRLQDRIADLANVPSRVAREVSDEIGELMQAEFDAGTDPYGSPWQELAEATVERGRTPPPLTDTRAMRVSLQVRPMSGAGIAITIDHPAAPHQTGWSGTQGEGPARPILPDRGDLPETWQIAIEEATSKTIRRMIGRR